MNVAILNLSEFSGTFTVIELYYTLKMTLSA